MGPMVFGGVSWMMEGDQRTAIISIGMFFVVGLILLRRMDR